MSIYKKTMYRVEVELAESYNEISSDNSRNKGEKRPFKVKYQAWGESSRDVNRYLFIEGRVVVLIDFECALVDQPGEALIVLSDGPTGISMLVVNDERSGESMISSGARGRNNASICSSDINDSEIYLWSSGNSELSLHRGHFPRDAAYVFDKISSLVMENSALKSKRQFPFPPRESFKISMFRTAAMSSLSVRFSIAVKISNKAYPPDDSTTLFAPDSALNGSINTYEVAAGKRRTSHRPNTIEVIDSVGTSAELIFSNSETFDRFKESCGSAYSVYISGFMIHHLYNLQVKTIVADSQTTFKPVACSTDKSDQNPIILSESSCRESIQRDLDPIECQWHEFWNNYYYCNDDKSKFKNQQFIIKGEIASITIWDQAQQINATCSQFQSQTSKNNQISIEQLIQVCHPSSNQDINEIQRSNKSLSVLYRSSTFYLRSDREFDKCNSSLSEKRSISHLSAPGGGREGQDEGISGGFGVARVGGAYLSSQTPNSFFFDRYSFSCNDESGNKRDNQSNYRGDNIIPLYVSNEAWTRVFSNVPACYVCKDIVQGSGIYAEFCRVVVGLLNSGGEFTFLVAFKAFHDQNGNELTYDLVLDDVIL